MSHSLLIASWVDTSGSKWLSLGLGSSTDGFFDWKCIWLWRCPSHVSVAKCDVSVVNILLRLIITFLVCFWIEVASKALCLFCQTEVGLLGLVFGVVFWWLVFYHLSENSHNSWIREESLHQVSLFMRFKVWEQHLNGSVVDLRFGRTRIFNLSYQYFLLDLLFHLRNLLQENGLKMIGFVGKIDHAALIFE